MGLAYKDLTIKIIPYLKQMNGKQFKHWALWTDSQPDATLNFESTQLKEQCSNLYRALSLSVPDAFYSHGCIHFCLNLTVGAYAVQIGVNYHCASIILHV